MLRHALARIAISAGATVVMTTATLLLTLGTDLAASVSVGHVFGLSLAVGTLIATSLSGALSYRSAKLMRELTLARVELSRMSRTDELTGLLNRRGFEKAAGRALTAARMSRATVTLFMCDIDHFKSINDRFGHEAGDKVLVEMAEILRHLAQTRGALVSRYGGEEFAGLISGSTPQEAERGKFRARDDQRRLHRVRPASRTIRSDADRGPGALYRQAQGARPCCAGRRALIGGGVSRAAPDPARPRPADLKPSRIIVPTQRADGKKKGLQLAPEPLHGRASPGECPTAALGSAVPAEFAARRSPYML